MGVKQIIRRTEDKVGNRVAKLSKLSPEQLEQVDLKRQEYLADKPDPNDPNAVALTEKLLAANSVEIYNAYLPQIKQLYVPVDETAEYDGKPLNAAHNIRYFKITKWVTDKKENSLEKLVNVYEVLSNEECNIALVFHRGMDGTDVYLAVINTNNAPDNNDVNSYETRIEDAIRGNFPGSEWTEVQKGIIPCLKDICHDSVATATNIPTEKSEKFISQTIEKLLDGIVPDRKSKEYTLILLATPIQDVDSRKLRLEEIYSGLAPYAGWQTNYTFNESSSIGSSATVGVNVGASAGIQQGQNNAITNSSGQTQSQNQTIGKNQSESVSDAKNESTTHSEGTSESDTLTNSESTSRTHSEGEHVDLSANKSTSAGASVEPGGMGGHVDTSSSHGITAGKNWVDGVAKSISKSISKTVGKNVSNAATEGISHALTETVGKSISNTLGKAVTKSTAVTSGVFKGTNFGVNFGANFARTSNVTATVGKNEGITQSFTNYNVKHSLDLLDEQMKRYEESSALGMWDFAAYVLSEDYDVANNVAHSYIALTEGTKSFMSKNAVNLWRGDTAESGEAQEICKYLQELRHPVFGLNPNITDIDESLNVYPSIVTATTALTGKELAYSLNFPKKSVVGLPVIECAEFGRNVITYEGSEKDSTQLHLGHIFHMNHMENTDVSLSKQSLASHTFITGSTGSGKSNTVYQILGEARKDNVHFLVIEPAKGEYKNVFGNDPEVSVYGTNPELSDLLKLNPFSFPKGIHVFEHMDRLVEIFNACWPMYAAMPAVLKNAIEKSYEDCGWNLTNSVNPYGEDLYPNFSDVARNIRTIIDNSEYDTDNKGAYKGSLLTRLQSLTNGINGEIFSDDEIPENTLFDQNVIIDLSRVGSIETKSLLMGIIILKLQEYRITGQEQMNGGLQHLTVLEEAHNLLKRTSTEQSIENGNLQGKSVEMISNAIAEMRTYGEGFIIADQAPGLLDQAAIRNTNTKIIMRLPDQDDRELVGKAAALNEDQINELAKLPCGVAAVYQNNWIQPVLCKIDYFNSNNGPYQYQRQSIKKKEISEEDALNIAELLSKGTQLDKETILQEIKPKLDSIHMDASSKVTIYRMLSNPPEEPRMTKLAPIMAKLFPESEDVMKKAYQETSDASKWTQEIENNLNQSLHAPIDNQVRRDIVQGIVTEYLINELNSESDFQKWYREGRLS